MLIVDKFGNITLTRKDTAYLKVIPQIQDEDTKEFSDYIMEEGDRVVFRIQRERDVFEKDCQVDLETNSVVLTLVPDDTASLDIRTYYFEFELITSRGEHFTFIAKKRITMDKEIEANE